MTHPTAEPVDMDVLLFEMTAHAMNEASDFTMTVEELDALLDFIDELETDRKIEDMNAAGGS